MMMDKRKKSVPKDFHIIVEKKISFLGIFEKSSLFLIGLEEEEEIMIKEKKEQS
jgi:hypothetical protein